MERYFSRMLLEYEVHKAYDGIKKCFIIVAHICIMTFEDEEFFSYLLCLNSLIHKGSWKQNLPAAYRRELAFTLLSE